MATWHCSCGNTNQDVQPDCRHCGRRRPVDLGKASYCKGRGHTFNEGLTYCTFCGWRPDEDPPIRDAPQPPSGSGKTADESGGFDDLRRSIKRQSRGILDDIRAELDASLKGAAASIDDLRAGRAGPVADAPPKTPSVPPHVAGPQARVAAAGPVPFQRVTTRNLEVRVAALPKLNYALLHAGLPLIQTLEIVNTAKEPANDVLARAWVAPDYGEPWQRSIASIASRQTHAERSVIVPLKKARLQEVREAERAGLRVELLIEGALQFSETYPLEVLAYNEWYYHPAIPETIACFVQPNSEAIETVVSLVRDRLRKAGQDAGLSGYQAGQSSKVVAMLDALYGVLQEDLRLSYIEPPPSFERPEPLADGGFTISQKIFFPEQILEHRRGTCLDLALLCASCVERMGLHPLFFLIRGHAFFGAWLREQALVAPTLRDHAVVIRLLDSGDWLALNSTTFAASEPATFEVCQNEGRALLADKAEFQCAVDLMAARRAGLKPIPPLVRTP